MLVCMVWFHIEELYRSPVPLRSILFNGFRAENTLCNEILPLLMFGAWRYSRKLRGRTMGVTMAANWGKLELHVDM